MKEGFFVNWTGAKKGNGFEFHLLAIALAIVIMVEGAGPISLDRTLYLYVVTKDQTALARGTGG